MSELEIPRPHTVHERLRNAAEWLDVYDRFLIRYLDTREAKAIYTPGELDKLRHAFAGKSVQDDLRNLADGLESGALVLTPTHDEDEQRRLDGLDGVR